MLGWLAGICFPWYSLFMLDINFIKDNKKLVKDTVKKRGIDTEKADIDAILKFEKIRREKQQELDEVNRERNLAAKARLFEKGRGLKAKAQDLGAEIRAAEKLIFKYWQWVPNVLSPKVPEGKSEDDNKEIRKWGKVPEFKFVPKSHEELGKSLEILDIERGAKVAGSGFYYFKGLGASLAWGLYNFALDYLKKQGFEQVMVPLFTREPALFGTGYFPFIGEDSYKLENEDLYAIGTSEQPLVAIHQNEVLEEANLPYQYTSFSACFRQEAGSYGKDVKGIFRVHQFHKVEQIVFCRSENSQKWHQKCLAFEEDLLKKLKLPYRVVDVCVGDMGAPGFRKFDCEAWFPSQRRYREVSSNTNLTDFQTRRLNIKVKGKDGEKYFPHTISATGVTDRWVAAILENYQQKDGSVKVPQVLQKYVGIEIINPKS